MSSDIKLDGERVVVNASDIILDFIRRRKAGSDPSGTRRALVHGNDDNLIINYDGDYPGRVMIRGHVLLEHTLYARGLARFERPPEVPNITITELSDPTSRLGGGDLGVGGGIIPPPHPTLVDIINELREKIEELETRISSLEE